METSSRKRLHDHDAGSGASNKIIRMDTSSQENPDDLDESSNENRPVYAIAGPFKPPRGYRPTLTKSCFPVPRTVNGDISVKDIMVALISLLPKEKKHVQPLSEEDVRFNDDFQDATTLERDYTTSTDKSSMETSGSGAAEDTNGYQQYSPSVDFLSPKLLSPSDLNARERNASYIAVKRDSPAPCAPSHANKSEGDKKKRVQQLPEPKEDVRFDDDFHDASTLEFYHSTRADKSLMETSGSSAADAEDTTDGETASGHGNEETSSSSESESESEDCNSSEENDSP